MTALFYPEDLTVVKGEHSSWRELEVWGEADGLILVHHYVLVRNQVQQHVLLSVLHSGGSPLSTTVEVGN